MVTIKEMKSTKYNLFSNLQNGSASSKGKRFNLQSKYHDTAILTCLWYITKICFRTVHGRNIIFFSVLHIEDMFEVHIVNSNILTSKNLFFFRNGPRKAHSLVPSPSQCVKAQSWTPGIFFIKMAGTSRGKDLFSLP